jgi:release factor glutamine methyltransferase
MTINIGEQTIEAVLDEVFTRLEKVSDTPGLDAQVVLANLLERSRSWMMAHPEMPLTGDQSLALEHMLKRLEDGEPLPYVLGRWEFFGLEFDVSKEVLIPRPETELLVERAAAWLQAHPLYTRVADIGTGCGCIGISLALNVPWITVMATDISSKALELARWNAVKHGVESRIEFVQQDLLPNGEEFHLIVSNPPYIPTATLHKLPIFGREPTLALDGGTDGLDLVRRILMAAPNCLTPGGLFLMEIEASEGPAVVSLAYDAFSEAQIHLHKDLSGNERLLEIQV